MLCTIELNTWIKWQMTIFSGSRITATKIVSKLAWSWEFAPSSKLMWRLDWKLGVWKWLCEGACWIGGLCAVLIFLPRGEDPPKTRASRWPLLQSSAVAAFIVIGTFCPHDHWRSLPLWSCLRDPLWSQPS